MFVYLHIYYIYFMYISELKHCSLLSQWHEVFQRKQPMRKQVFYPKLLLFILYEFLAVFCRCSVPGTLNQCLTLRGLKMTPLTVINTKNIYGVNEPHLIWVNCFKRLYDMGQLNFERVILGTVLSHGTLRFTVGQRLEDGRDQCC